VSCDHRSSYLGGLCIKCGLPIPMPPLRKDELGATVSPPTRVYHVRGTHHTWARIWVTDDGCITTISDHGNYGYWFTHPGCEFRKFLCEVDDDYITRKLAGGENELDENATDRNVRELIIRLRRARNIDKCQARTEWNNIPTDWHDEVDRSEWYLNTELPDASEVLSYCPPLQVRMFVKVLWPLFIAQLRAELEAEKSGSPAPAPRQEPAYDELAYMKGEVLRVWKYLSGFEPEQSVVRRLVKVETIIATLAEWEEIHDWNREGHSCRWTSQELLDRQESDLLSDLNERVTAAILRAEHLPPGVEANLAFGEVSRIEEEIARLTTASSIEGDIARRGAITAALSAGEGLRALKLSEAYLAELTPAEDLVKELAMLRTEAAEQLAKAKP